MRTITLVVFSLLLSSALFAPLKVTEETKTMFLGEDFQILLPSLEAEVTFRSKTGQEVLLMRDGTAEESRAKLNDPLSHLIVYDLNEEKEGLYTVKNNKNSDDVRRIKLFVRDCTIEHNVKYGDNYHIQLAGVNPPITLEYRHSAIEANQTDRPALVLLTRTGGARDGYKGRVSANDRRVTLNAVTGADEGSYTVRDGGGNIKRKACLNVKEHQNFLKLPYAGTLKINLILNSSLVQVSYTPSYDTKSHVILSKGELLNPPDLGSLEGRLSLDGSVCVLEGLRGSDAGQFQVTDILGYPVSSVNLQVEPYKLPTVYVAIIALVGLLAFLLLVCLLSCLVKVKKRAKRAAALEKIAQSKEDDGDAFRQVVKNIQQFNDESKGYSMADNTDKSQSTEVDIKGLEVSSKEILEGANLETSDSGVEFNTTGLPLDTDTDTHDHILDSEAVSISVAQDTKASAPPAPEPKSAPVPEVKSSLPLVTKASSPPVTKASPPPVTKSSPPPETKFSPPQVTKFSPPQVTKSSPPPVTKSSPPQVTKSSPPQVTKSSPPSVTKSSPPQVTKSSPPQVTKSSPPSVTKSSPPQVTKSSPPPVTKSSPPPVTKSSPPQVTKSSPPPVTKSSPPPVTKAIPPLVTKSSPPPVIKSSPPSVTKSSPPPVIKSSPPPVTKPSPPPVIKSSPPPETKKSPEPPAEPKLTVTKPVDTKPSPVQSPDLKPALSPISKLSPIGGLESKTPEPKPSPIPSPEPKSTTPLTPTPKTDTPQPPEPKLAVTPTREPAKPTTPEPAPTTNGTLEPAPESKTPTDPTSADLIGGSFPKATPPKTPEVEVTAAKEPPLEVSSGSPTLEAKVDESAPTVTEDTTTTTTT